MKILRYVLLTVFLFVFQIGFAGETLTVMTYNIHHGEGMDGKIDMMRIADVIESVSPDLVALQEVDHITRRSNGVNQAAEVGHLTGMNYAFGKAMEFEGGFYGLAVLSRSLIDGKKTHTLPFSPGHEPRIVLEIKIRHEGETITFFNTHLDHITDSPDRMAAIKSIESLVEKNPNQSIILAGDLNALPNSNEIERLRKHWMIAGDAAELESFPSSDPNRLIDYIAVRPEERWKVHSTRVIPEKAASDHRPIVSEIELVQQ